MRPVRAVEFVQDFGDDLGTRVGTNRIKSVADDAVACERVRDRCQAVREPNVCGAARSLAPQTFGFELDGEYERVCKTCCRHDLRAPHHAIMTGPVAVFQCGGTSKRDGRHG